MGMKKRFSTTYCCWKLSPLCYPDKGARSGEIRVFSGLFLEMCFRQGPVRQLQLQEAPPSPLSSRPERSVVERSAVSAVLLGNVFSTGSCSATTVAGSAALPFVISTGAQRSGEICGVSGLFLEMCLDRG